MMDMFGLLSPMKLILLAVIIVGVWYLFKRFSHNNDHKNTTTKEKNVDEGAQMIACKKCGTFFATTNSDINNAICDDCRNQ